MKQLLLLLVLACPALSAMATATVKAKADDVSWLTVAGDASDPHVDTIQIDPNPLETKGRLRWMTLRLNRAKQRTSTDGFVFRSFTSVVEFDCDKNAARFTKTQFYDGPLWTSPGRAMTYPAAMVRPMAFREFEPNPRERVVRAACFSTASVATRR